MIAKSGVERRVGHLTPFARFKLDLGRTLPGAPLFEFAANGGSSPPSERWNEQKSPDDVGYKPWKSQKDSAQNGAEPRCIEVNGPNTFKFESGKKTLQIATPGSPEQIEPRKGGPHEQKDCPDPAE